MTSISVPELLTIIFVFVDDRYQAQGVQYLKGKPGAKPEFSDSEVIQMGVCQRTHFILDTKPVPVINVKRSNRRSDFAGSASYGHCVSRNMKYFGYILVAITTLDGVPLVYELVPAHMDERAAAETEIYHLSGCDILCDKGFIGQRW